MQGICTLHLVKALTMWDAFTMWDLIESLTSNFKSKGKVIELYAIHV